MWQQTLAPGYTYLFAIMHIGMSIWISMSTDSIYVGVWGWEYLYECMCIYVGIGSTYVGIWMFVYIDIKRISKTSKGSHIDFNRR